MNQPELFEKISPEQAGNLTYEEQGRFINIQQDIIRQLQSQIKKFIAELDKSEQTILLKDEFILLKNKIFGRSSEKSDKDKNKKKSKERGKKRKRVLLPSDRYPNIPIKDQEIDFVNPPNCDCCGHLMSKTGLTEDSEHLTVIPAKYMIIRQRRHKYRCGNCQSCLRTTPVPPRITPGGKYSDEMIVDASLSKYCDLIPMERYSAIAGRSGLVGLPPHSLIESSHQLSNFVERALDKIKNEVLESDILKADETPHRLLQLNKRGYLWGFSSSKAAYFEIHSTRAGEVAKDFLRKSKCRFLISDAFSGYAKAVREANEFRDENTKIQTAYCNAHSRRKFRDAEKVGNDESIFFIKCYRKIYRMQSKLEDPNNIISLEKIRNWQKLYFKLMKRKSIELEPEYSRKSAMGKAISYFLKFYDGLTLFMEHSFSIDNNDQERLLRNPVIGRKTWYGTQSPRGARTTSVLFSLVESCKLNKVNPREYFKELVAAIHSGKDVFTPAEFSTKKP